MSFLDSLSGWALRKSMDRWLSIMLTHKCNYNCKYCLYGDREETMDFEKAKEILKEAKELKYKSVSFSGGEPSLHPHFLEIIEYANSLGFEIEIVTNGFNIKEKEIQHLRKVKKLRIAVSLDHYDRKKNDDLRGDGSYDNALRLWSVIKNDKVDFITLVTKENLYDLPSIVRFVLEDLGANTMTCFRAVPQGNAAEGFLDKHDDMIFYVNSLNKLDNYYKERGKRIFLGCGTTKEETCQMIDNWIMIMPDGTLSPCCYLPQLEYFKYKELGDLKKFLEKDFRTEINDQIDKVTIEGRRKSIRKFGVSFCYNCVEDLRDKKVIL